MTTTRGKVRGTAQVTTQIRGWPVALLVADLVLAGVCMAVWLWGSL